jgi:hypothetical protein
MMPTAGATSPPNARPESRPGLDLLGVESEREGGEGVADDGGCHVDEVVVEHDDLSKAREECMTWSSVAWGAAAAKTVTPRRTSHGGLATAR